MPSSGELLWKTHIDEHPHASITGAPVYYEARVYVPLVAAEEGTAMNPKYECCSARGGVIALDAADRQADLENLHHRRNAASGAEELGRHHDVGTLRRQHLVGAHHRSRTATSFTSAPAIIFPIPPPR